MEKTIDMMDKYRNERLWGVVIESNGWEYLLRDRSGNTYRLFLEFYGVERIPTVNDIMYFTPNMVSAMKQHLFMYSFSAQHGSPSARAPHDFASNPDEFLILEYADGGVLLLQQLYG